MAAAFRSALHGGINSKTCNKPTGVTSGDILIAHLIDEGNHTITPPSGWTQIDNILVSSSIRHASFWKLAGGSEPSSYTWTITGSTYTEVTISAFSGCDNSTPINAHNIGSDPNSPTFAVPNVTTTVANCILSTACNEWFGHDWSSGGPTGYTVDSGVTLTSALDMAPFHRSVTTATTYGGEVPSWNNGNGGNFKSISVVALAPSGGTTTQKTLTSTARITASTSKTLTSTARITVTGVQKTLTSTARIQLITQKTLSSVARITAATQRTLTSTARITASAQKTLTSVARITAATQRTLTSTAAIVALGSTQRTLTSTARITKTGVQRTLTSTARLQRTSQQTLASTARITRITQRTLTSTARITAQAQKTLTSTARLQRTTSKTLTSVARLQRTTQRTLTSTAHIVASGAPLSVPVIGAAALGAVPVAQLGALGAAPIAEAGALGAAPVAGNAAKG